MRAPSQTLTQAYAILGLHGPTDGDAVRRAFRTAVKAARPDLPGGDDDRFRRVIAAWRLILEEGGALTPLEAPKASPEALPVVGINPVQAVLGGQTTVRLGQKRLKITVAPGMRTGDHLRLRGAAADGADLYLPILIRPSDGLTVLGDDLHMSWAVAPRLIEDGGRVEIDTYAGTRGAWVTPGLTVPVRIRLRDMGLPARGSRPAGHLFVTLQPSEDAPSAAEHLLARFTRVWTPERLAA
ncbi:DnaJ C-terminal domain-containing protein [Brevundimonas goettingensis]|uniref:J domain-containing protein n=1 Tax=Brevundimonas goettingensis TaxID=2774190 RepID=A0A975GWC9_9CAUL|nr:DnaJ C-terminal domain-containing protein [Brevundimonas goettingensis]QTC91688.1 J domain-containing protein [Brevundimonas goettingensis]